MKVRQIVMTAMLAVILFVVQITLSFLPNIELVSLLIILYTLVFPKQVLWAVYVFALIEGLTFGFGIWWLNYLYVWTILVFIVWLCRKNESVIVWAVISGAFGLSFGALCAIPYIIVSGFYAGVAYWISGIPFDLAHCAGNVIVVLLLFKPLLRALKTMQNKATYR